MTAGILARGISLTGVARRVTAGMQTVRRLLALFLSLLVLRNTSAAAPIGALAYSPDGATLVAGAGEKIRVCAPATGAMVEEIPTAGLRVSALAFSPDGALLAVGGGTPGEKGEVRLLDWPGKKWLAKFAVNEDLVTSVAFSPDGARLAVACADHTAHVLSIEERGQRFAKQFVLTGHSAAMQAIAFSPDGKLVVTASLDRAIKVWSAADGTLQRSLGNHTDAIQCLAFRPLAADAQPRCASAGDDQTIRIWQPAIGRMVRIIRGAKTPILSLAYTPDGRSLYTAGQEGLVRQIDAESDTVLSEWQASTEWIHQLAISPDGRYLAAGDWAGKIFVKAIR